MKPRFKIHTIEYLGSTLLEQTDSADISVGYFGKNGCVVYGIVEVYGNEKEQYNCYAYARLKENFKIPTHIADIYQKHKLLIDL